MEDFNVKLDLANDLAPRSHSCKKDWKEMSEQCCNGNPYECDYWGYLSSMNMSDICFNLTVKFYDERGLDPYDLYYNCYLPGAGQAITSTSSFITRQQTMLRHLYKLAHLQYHDLIGSIDFNPNPPMPQCSYFNDSAGYLSRADVRQALHVPDFVQTWESCSEEVSSNYVTNYLSVASQVNAIIAANKTVLIYNGDIDSVCNAMGNSQFVAYDVNTTLIYENEAWTITNSLPNVAGFHTRYQGITFLTVRGAGHFVPSEKPIEALQMIGNFIQNKNFSQPITVDVTPSCTTHFCDETIVSENWMVATMRDLCGKPNQCQNMHDRGQCVCNNGMDGTFCNEYPVTTTTPTPP